MAGIAYRPALDGLRAVAVLVVMLFHAGAPLAPGGFVGVDVFFVISGYLITSLLRAEHATTGRVDFAAFYARRARRLLPALLLVVGATLALGVWWLPPLDVPLRGLVDSAGASVLFVANLYFRQHAGGYFDGPSEELPLLHLWSLGVEEQFYLVHPLLLVAILHFAGPRAARVLFALAVASLLVAEAMLQVDTRAAFFQMPARFWELATGALIALAPASRPPSSAVTHGVIGSGLALLAANVWWLPPGPAFPGFGAIPAVAAAALVVWGAHSAPADRPVFVLSSRPVVVLGLISYPLYLWHWPLLALERARVAEPASPGLRLALCVVALGLAWLTWRFLERPVRRLAWPSRRVIGAGLAASLVLAAGAQAIPSVVPRPDAARLADAARSDRPPDMERCHFSPVMPVSALHAGDCETSPGRPVRVVIWGDSHALALKPFAAALAARAGGSAMSHTLDACPPVRDFQGQWAAWPAHRENCRRMNLLVLNALQRRNVDTVVLAANWPMHGFREGHPVTTGASADDVETGLTGTLDDLAGHVRRVLLVSPTPQLPRGAPECIASGRPHACDVAVGDHVAATRAIREMQERAAARYPFVRIVDTDRFFCDHGVCGPMRGNVVLYWDAHHVTSTAARDFAAWTLARQPELSPSAPGTR